MRCSRLLKLGLKVRFACLITEQDVFGVPARVRRGGAVQMIFCVVSSLEAGDLVVHVEHGIGRYEGLRQSVQTVPIMTVFISAMRR